MDYEKLYNKIIKNRLENPLPKDVYGEVHHIIPRSLGGTDDKNNLVRLTAREHFVCHYLLAKMYPKESFEWYKMNHAFLMMKAETYNHKRYFNSRLYEALKENFSIVMRKSSKGESNSQYGTCWIYNEELEENKKIKRDELHDWLGKGWKEGRILNWDRYKKKKEKSSEKYKRKKKKIHLCEKYNKQLKDKKKLLIRLKIVLNVLSITKAAKIVGISQPGLTKFFKKKMKNYSLVFSHGKIPNKKILHREILELTDELKHTIR